MVDEPRQERDACVLERSHDGAIFAERAQAAARRSDDQIENISPCPTLRHTPSSEPEPRPHDEPRLVRRGRAVQAPGRGLPRRPLRGEPDRAPRADRRHARRADSVRGRPHLRGGRGQARADPGPRAQRSGRPRSCRETFSFGQGITGWAVEHREPVLANKAHLDPRVRFVPGTPVEPEALIAVPLIARGRLKGTLNIYRVGEDAPSRTRSSTSRRASATRPRSRSTTPTSAPGSSTRPRPTR